eukprot:SAG22_NODE_575_length_8991_cov_12.134859_7_plen_124_part_00
MGDDDAAICWPSLSIPIESCCLTRRRERCSKLTVSPLPLDFFRLLDADLINMTIGTECPLAAEAGLSYCAIAMATDYDCWKEDEEVSSSKALSVPPRASTGGTVRSKTVPFLAVWLSVCPSSR